MTHFWKNLQMGITGFIALVSCPCHLPATLPIILTLTAGTSLGLWIANNTGVVAIISSLIFVGSMFLTFRLVNKQSETCPVPQNTKVKRTPNKDYAGQI
ncbi:hypothetical protein G4Y79_01295 [Phototrophicus methaneseepsis]|uniref:Uncharacterized protein n=1 Tax=Phototrophicus methaneseepsis TaxID=2710758 RepID=A0A7S8IF18_9CHLR|nr:hypothetical protein [Phototrophicus methaneseepsis]QPC83039.1 hypothetical protein G4Y79_01295 [Phototrophicus methaneseepsis]